MLSILFEISSQIGVAELAGLNQRCLGFMSGTSKPYFSMVKLCCESISKVKVTVWLSLLDRLRAEQVATLFRLEIHFQIAA